MEITPKNNGRCLVAGSKARPRSVELTCAPVGQEKKEGVRDRGELKRHRRQGEKINRRLARKQILRVRNDDMCGRVDALTLGEELSLLSAL
jgi:hypothetical protein